jgi:hypothetical protein
VSKRGTPKLDQWLSARLSGLPDGAYAHSLWRRLNETGLAASRSGVAQRLSSLQRTGHVVIERRRWQDASFSGTDDTAATLERGATRGTLEAIPIELRATPPIRDQSTSPPGGSSVPNWDFLRQLSSHYAECLRLTGNSRLTQVPDRHGKQFVLVAPDRPSWWPVAAAGSQFRLSAANAPADLLEAFYQRRGYPAYIGYPLSVFHSHDGETFIRPVGLLECRWAVEDGTVVLTPGSIAPTLNTDWVGGLRRNRRMAQVMAWLGASDNAAEDGLTSLRAGDWTDVRELAQTLGIFLASELRGRLDPLRPTTRLELGTSGIFNCVGLFLPDVNRYTGRARRDLQTLSNWSDSELASTAIAPMLEIGGGRPISVPVLPPLSLGEDQLVGARDALAGPLTVISGPPGTGKSQVVVAIMVSAALAGRSVLLASRTHQALDAVEQRLSELLPGRVILARARAPEREREFDFRRALDAVLARAGETSTGSRLAAELIPLQALERRIWGTLEAADALAEATARLAELEAELERAEDQARSDRPEPGELTRTSSWVQQLVELIAGLFRITKRPQSMAVTIQRLRNARAVSETEHRRLVEALRRRPEEAPLEDSLETLQRGVRACLGLFADKLEIVSIEERPRLAALVGDLGLAKSAGGDGIETTLNLWRENADLVLKHFPLWAVTPLSAGGRIPLVPGLFDYVIFDEAATCELASALPLLARAKRAIIVGDKMQTGLVSDLEPRRELEMLELSGLGQPGIGRFAFTQASVFDLAAGGMSARRHMLRDHYRCSLQIADYISETFYGRRLNILTDESRLKAPRGMRPGLHWTNIEGPIERTGHGCIAPAEAEAIADHLVKLLEVEGYDGTVGVVTPFSRQAERIVRLCEGRLSPTLIDKSRLKVATSHSFQGDARDVVLISPC